ncbi:MAG: DUF6644 family protein, partial [Bradyrhizobium sp.]
YVYVKNGPFPVPPSQVRCRPVRALADVLLVTACRMTLNEICHWIDQTAISQWIQVAGWVVPTVQTIHILAIAVVASSALMLDLRLVGVFWANRPVEAVKARFLPLIWWPLLVLLTTGIIMITAEPARSLKNPAFQIKMGLLIAALIVTGLFQFLHRRNAAFGDVSGPRAAAVTLAIVSILLWSSIIFAGRWIAYFA